MAMSDAAKAARCEYMRQYRLANGDRLRMQARERYKREPERHRKYNERTWEKKATKSSEGFDFEKGFWCENSKGDLMMVKPITASYRGWLVDKNKHFAVFANNEDVKLLSKEHLEKYLFEDGMHLVDIERKFK